MHTPAFFLALAFLAVCGMVGGYDVYAAFALPPGNTVSAILYGWGQSFPVFPVVLGILLGHLFWPVGPRDPPSPISLPPTGGT